MPPRKIARSEASSYFTLDVRRGAAALYVFYVPARVHVVQPPRVTRVMNSDFFDAEVIAPIFALCYDKRTMQPQEKGPLFKVTPAANPVSTLKNCIVIQDGTRPELADIMGAARANGAFEDNSNEEAGDDVYLVQFPGHKQEYLEYDMLRGRLQSLLYPDLQDE